MPDPTAIYLQELALGLPWTMGHCTAMCGPILLALRFGARPGVAVHTVGASLSDLALYQLGRALVYGAAGAVVGGLGGMLSDGWRWGGVALASLVALVLLFSAARRFPVVVRHMPTVPGQALLNRGFARLVQLRARWPRLGTGLIGALMAGLPCGIAVWALALAAATASPWHGAGVMAVLVAMTSLPLAATVLASLAGRRLGWHAPRWLVPAGLVVGAVMMVTLAIGAARAAPVCPLCAAGHG